MPKRQPQLDIDQIREILQESVRQLEKHDFYLLKNDVSERAITHRLAIHVEALIETWDIDCEYNRNVENKEIVPKKIIDCIKCDGLGRFILGADGELAESVFSVFPDIIVHSRGKANNLIVIEIKKSTNPIPRECDIEKLRCLKGQLGYRNGVFIRLKTGKEAVQGDTIDEMLFV